MTELTTIRIPLIGLLSDIRDGIADELHARLAALGFTEIRPAHGCVFRWIEPEGSRLTSLAERSGLTKQAVGEAVTDLERMGYVERRPDPEDGRAKIIHLTQRGADALAAANGIFEDIERELGEQIGSERMRDLRESLERIYALTRAQRP